MSCRRVKNQLSPYLDERLTGREMLEIREHLDQCVSCHNEYLSIRQVKILLRSLTIKDPGYALEQNIYNEVANERYGILSLPFFSAPKRSRRIAAALVFSCIGILSVSIQIGSGELEANRPTTFQQVHEAIMVNIPILNSSRNTASIFPENDLRTLAPDNRQRVEIQEPIYPSGYYDVTEHRSYPMLNNSFGNQPSYVTLTSSH